MTYRDEDNEIIDTALDTLAWQRREIERLTAENERLRAAGDRLVVFVRHYPRCAIARGRDYCNCDHDTVIKAWKEARAALGDKQ